MRRLLVSLLLLQSWNFLPAVGLCNGTSAVGTFRLLVKSPAGGSMLPLRSVNNLVANSRIAYEPVQLPDSLKKNGKLTLVLVPADQDQRAVSGATVLEPRIAGATSEWTIPFRVGTLLLVFAPQGLDEKRVANLVSRDDDLIDDLALYAERTVRLESTISMFQTMDEEEEAVEDPSRALRGNPTEQALLTLTRALNPTSAYFNPLSAGPTVGPQTRSGLAASMFFENAGGVIPGGGALSMAKTWLLPDSEFRTVYAESAAPDGLTLCAQKTLSRSRNRVVYLWGYQLTNANAPKFSQSADLTLAAGSRNTIAVKAASMPEWPLLERVREWTLVNTQTNRETQAPVRGIARGWAEVDLRRVQVPPGSYRLKGRWDWETVHLQGTWRVSTMGDLKSARISPESATRLVENSGMAPVEIEGTDFQFVERVRLKRAGTLGAINTDLEFRLPQGFRAGPQNKLELEINTDSFHAGNYLLSVQQTDGKAFDVPLRVAPVPPKVANLPLRVHAGEAQQQRITLRGTDLDRLPATVEVPGGGLKLQMLDGTDTERDALVTLAADVRAGSRIRAGAYGLSFQVAGPKPKVSAVTALKPEDASTALGEGELPSGSLVSFTIRAENVDAPASLVADCSDPARSLGAFRIRLGERRAGGTKFDVAAGAGNYFAAFDPGAVGQSGCELQIAVESDANGKSAAMPAGRVVRLPKIADLTWSEEKAAGGYVAILRGTDLEVIEKAGWEGQAGIGVAAAPKAVAGGGRGDVQQSLRVVLPWPPPSPLAPVMIWLRGDNAQQAGRRFVVGGVAGAAPGGNGR